MKRKVFTTAILATFIIAAIISTATAQGPGRRGMGMGMGMGPGYGLGMGVLPNLTEKLTDEQVSKIKALHLEHQKEVIPLRAQMQIKQIEMRQLWSADTLDQAAITAKSREMFGIQGEVQEKAIAHHIAVANVLTKEQRQEFLNEGFGRRGFRQAIRDFGRGYRRGGPGWQGDDRPRRGAPDDDDRPRRGQSDDERPRRGPGGPTQG